jgi:hypothetical protein
MMGTDIPTLGSAWRSATRTHLASVRLSVLQPVRVRAVLGLSVLSVRVRIPLSGLSPVRAGRAHGWVRDRVCLQGTGIREPLHPIQPRPRGGVGDPVSARGHGFEVRRAVATRSRAGSFERRSKASHPPRSQKLWR